MKKDLSKVLSRNHILVWEVNEVDEIKRLNVENLLKRERYRSVDKGILEVKRSFFL